MTSQANITDFFNSRKRGGCTNVKSRAKVLVLEAEKCLKLAAQETSVTKARIVFQDAKSVKSETLTAKSSVIKKSTKITKKSSKISDSQPLKQSLLTKFATKTNSSSTVTSETKVEDESPPTSQATNLELSSAEKININPNISKTPSGPPIASKVLSGPSYSPKTVRFTPDCQAGPSSSPKIKSTLLDVAGHSSPQRMPNSPLRKLGTPRALLFGDSPAKRNNKTPNKELSLGEIRAKLKAGGSRTDELKSRLSKFSKLSTQLSQVEAEENSLKLKEFKSIEIDVPLSPCKAPYSSPVKVPLSPLKSPGKTLGSRLAAWQQYRTLAESRAPTLPLPWRYRGLYDKFKAVDVVVNMMVNRGETCTMAKLQPAVEEMTRLSFSEHYLAQINFLFPSAFTFTQQRRGSFALTGRPDKYELIISPNYDTQEDCDEKGKAGPRALQKRYEKLHTILVSKVMDFHEEFLSHLDPPMTIPRDKLTRWHPGFDVEQIPDVEVAPLPQPPHQDKCTSAREVLDRARNMMSCNLRVQEALARVSERQQSDSKVTEEKQVSNIATQSSDSSSAPVPVNPALRGIPSSLLEKIRARQAARAVEAMTRSAAEDVEQSKLQQLPELARITRNIFVSEKKNVLPCDVLIDKLSHSYPHSVTHREIVELVDLLVIEAPTLLQRLNMRQTTFFKVNKDTKMAAIIAGLEKKLKPI